MNTEIKSAFENLYLEVRKKENRLYTDELVASLPEIGKKHPLFEEWETRRISFVKFKNQLVKKNRSLHILDLGCGNGWMSNKLSEIPGAFVTGIDRNAVELAQAKRVFQFNKKLSFISGDVIHDDLFPIEHFDIIVLAASIQYFPELSRVIKKLLKMLKAEGEIHIFDSHFYTAENARRAKEASFKYYKSLKSEEMTGFYHHHQWSDLSPFHFRIMNRGWKDNLLLKLFKTKKNYFPWIVIYKLN